MTASRSTVTAATTIALGLLAALLTWRIPSLAPGPGLDASWMAALNIAARDGLIHGEDIVFTHGPAGLVLYPKLYFGPYAAAATAGSFLVLALTTTTVLGVGRRRGALWLAIGLALVAGVLASAIVASQLLVLLLSGLCAWAVTTPNGRRAYLSVAAAAACAAVLLLAKFNDGVAAVCVTVLASAALASGTRDLKVFAWALLVLSGSVMATWVLVGQPVDALFAFVSHSLELSTGFSTAMGLEDPERAWEYPAAAVIVTLLGISLVAGSSGLAAWRRWTLAGIAATVLFFAYKHGFVRHDVHGAAFFAVTSLIGVAVVSAFHRRAAASAALTASLVCFVWASDIKPDRLDIVANVGSTWERLQQLVIPAERRSVVEHARTAMQATYGVDDEILAAVRGRTVHVDPWEAGIVWAYYGLFEWRPMPVFQAYSAYTNDLDQLNARFLADDERAPERILRAAPAAIDGRNAAWESPMAILEMVCRYRELAATAAWQVLSRSDYRCGEPRLLDTVTAPYGRPVAIPPGRQGEMVFARIRFDDAGPLSWLRSAVYKAPTYFATMGGSKFRLVPGTASGPLLLRVPDTVGYSPALGPLLVEADLLTVEMDEMVGAGGTVTIEFYSSSVKN